MGAIMTLGDAGAPNDDASYTGDTGDSVFGMQYYRNKAAEFQSVLIAVDQSAQAARDAIDANSDNQAMVAELQALLADFDAKRWQFRATAEAINAGAALVNSAGGRFPQLSIPNGLGAFPVFPAAAVAAVGVAAGLIVWGLSFTKQVANTLQRYVTLQQIEDPAKRGEIAAILARADQAASAAETPIISSVAGIVKWVAIGAIAFLAYKQFGGNLKIGRSSRDDDDFND